MSAGPEYDIDAAAKYIQRRFQQCNHSPKKEVYPHFTTATDTSNMEVVFQVVTNTIVKDNLETVGLMWERVLAISEDCFVKGKKFRDLSAIYSSENGN